MYYTSKSNCENRGYIIFSNGEMNISEVLFKCRFQVRNHSISKDSQSYLFHTPQFMLTTFLVNLDDVALYLLAAGNRK